MAEIRLFFYDTLRELVKTDLSESGEVKYCLRRKASIKDVVECLGVPHPEIKRLVINKNEKGFDYIVQDGDSVEVWPIIPVFDLFTASILRPVPLDSIRFIVDVNAGKLATLLRMAGFDTAYRNEYQDVMIARLSAKEKRILLTRDRNLLKRKIVQYGHLIKEIEPKKQFEEVIRLFGLKNDFKPFSRCMVCNEKLFPIAKETVLHRLEPLTRMYYDSFQICRKCDKIYWAGSHCQKMKNLLAAL